MFTETIATRFSDTDALGHINNTMIPIWFEGARDPIFRMFSPNLDTTAWQLILAKIEVNYLNQLYYGQPIEIRTWVARIGTSSFDVYQELWQNQQCGASGTAVMVHYDYQLNKSIPLSDNVRMLMQQHLKINE
jgi:acyl-CoA thioester hydrolase